MADLPTAYFHTEHPMVALGQFVDVKTAHTVLAAYLSAFKDMGIIYDFRQEYIWGPDSINPNTVSQELRDKGYERLTDGSSLLAITFLKPESKPLITAFLRDRFWLPPVEPYFLRERE